MSPWFARFAHLANALAGGTGLAYAYTRYLARPADEFAVVNHPWQPHLLHLHVLLAPLLVLVIGHLLVAHGLYHVRRGTREGRVSGLIIGVSALPMVFSGYAIQVSVNPAWRLVWIGAHLAFSAAWLLAYLGHWIVHVRARRRARPHPC